MAANVKRDISDVIVNTDVLAGLLGFTRQRVNQLAKEGILEKKAPGRFPLMQNIKRYVEFLRTGQKDEEEEATAQYWEEKALHEKAKRELAELKLSRQRNLLHDAVDVELAITNMLVTFRNRILGVPQKVAPKIIGLTNLAEIMEVINTELLEVLTELSEYDPAMFAGGEDIEEEDDEIISKDAQIGGSSSKTGRQSVGG
jgi:phage terminase Nu1 subunit (DNA packaging protein)